MKILFVENHTVFAEIVRAKFLGGHEVVTVPSLASAREALAAQSFDAILLDYDLDDGKGVDLLLELRASGNRVPVVAVSAKAECNQVLVAAGASASVSKLEFGKIVAVLKSLPTSSETA